MDAISTVSRAVDTKSNMESVKGILIQASGEMMTLTGYDFEMGIKTSFECDVYSEGRIVLPNTLLSNIVRMSESPVISIESDDNLNCNIKAGAADYNIKGIDPSDYPDFPATSRDHRLVIENSLFTEMCDYVSYAVSLDEKRPAHTGILFKMEGEKLIMVALDGFRLAVCERNVDFEDDFQIIIPAKTMNEVRKIVGDIDGKLTIYVSNRYVVFNAGEFIVLSRLLEGEFLDYRRAIPTSFTTDVLVNTRDLTGIVERASLIITERLKNPIRMEVSGGKLSVRCTTELGRVYDEMPVVREGDDITIGFNNKYILDALKNGKMDEMRFLFKGPLSPCKIIPKTGDAFTYLVLPVRFRNDD